MRYQPIKPEKIAENIRVRRSYNKWTMTDLQEASGVSRWTINNIENCKNETKMRSLELIAKAFDCRVEDLLY